MCGFASAIVAGGTESMSLVPMGGHKIAPNPALVDRYPDVYLTTGLVAENHAREVGHLARGAGRLRACAATSARSPRSTPAGSPTRSCRSTRRVESSKPTERQNGNDSDHVRAGDASPSTKGRGATRRPRRSRSCGRPSTRAARVTAGNSSQTSDGAAAVIVTSAERAQASAA